ncbi:MAG: putative membrane protein [Rhodobacteraceae bacterium HLUCCO07]|nr:MAG: putative membrane protein [Rhodobacteraceae bacterium HLUCCO07]
MTLTPFFDSSLVVQLHIVTALAALAIGPVALMRRRRDRLHRTLGYVWVTAMAVTALSSFFIYTIRILGPFSPIHALSAATLVLLWVGIGHIRAGRVADHRRTMLSLYVFGMGIPGLFTLLPGRIMNAILFPTTPVGGFGTALAMTSAIALVWGLRRPDHIRLLLGRA